MAIPRLNRDDCADIHRMYADRSRKESTFTLAKLFRVTPGTILRVIDNRYTPLEDYQERLVAKRKSRAEKANNGD